MATATAMFLFQSTPPRRGRRSLEWPRCWSTISFNPRPRAGGDISARSASGPGRTFQSTPPRRGRQRASCWGCPQGQVSIHAPAQGATPGLLYVYQGFKVSIHAPAQGATTSKRERSGRNRVSIHAPAQGATKWTDSRRASVIVSIHAPAQGATKRRDLEESNIEGFNPRPRAGGDFKMAEGKYEIIGFNPRPRAGGDICQEEIMVGATKVSIHAPAQGATQRGCRSQWALFMFQSTPPRRGRLVYRPCMLDVLRFQSTPPRRGRPVPSFHRWL